MSCRFGAPYRGWWLAAAPDPRSFDSCTDRPSCPTWNETVETTLADGIEPLSAAARSVVELLVGRYCETFGEVDDAAYRQRLIHRLEVGGDPLLERYRNLLAVVGGSQPAPSLGPVVGGSGPRSVRTELSLRLHRNVGGRG